MQRGRGSVTASDPCSRFKAAAIMTSDCIFSTCLNYFNTRVEESESEFVCMTEHIRADLKQLLYLVSKPEITFQ